MGRNFSLLLGVVLATVQYVVNADDIGKVTECNKIGDLLADPEDCASFYECDLNLKPIRDTCGSQLYWNQLTLSCDFPENVECDFDPDPIECDHAGEYIADPYDCGAYYECDEELVAHHMQCPEGLWWSEIWKTCEEPDQVHCNTTTTTVASSTTVTQAVTTPLALKHGEAEPAPVG